MKTEPEQLDLFTELFKLKPYFPDEDKKEIIFAVTDITSEHTVRQNLNI